MSPRRNMKRIQAREAVRKVYKRRRDAGLCILDARERGRPPHPAPRLGLDGKRRELCDMCTYKKNKLQQLRRQRKKAAVVE